MLLWSWWREIELKVCCWRWFSSDAVIYIDVSQGDLWIGRVEDETVHLLVDVNWNWRRGTRTLRSEGSVCDVGVMALPTHGYSVLSKMLLTIVVAMYSRRIHIFGEEIKTE